MALLALVSAAQADTLDWATRPATDLVATTDSATVGSITITSRTVSTGTFDVTPTSAIAPATSSNNSNPGIISLGMDAAADDSSAYQTTTFTFSAPVYNLSITIRDIDGGTGCACWNDLVDFNSNAGLPTSWATASGVAYNSATGRASASQDTTITNETGNITVTWAGPISSVTVKHIAGPRQGSPTNPDFQAVYIDDLIFATAASSASLKLRKISDGGTGTFSFTSTNLSSTPANITTTTAGTAFPPTPTPIPVATLGSAITIAETPATGFAATAASCTDANSATTGNTGTFGSLSGNVLTISAAKVVAGANFTCTFTNTRATVSIQKITLGSNGGAFSFADNNVAGTFANITTTAVNTAQPAPPTARNVTNLGAQVQLTETVATNFRSNGVTCTDANSAVTGNGPVTSTTSAITIPAANVVAGSAYNCVFTNSRIPTVKFQKLSIGGTTTFSFGSPVNIASAPGNINTGTSNPGPATPTAITVNTIGSQVQLTETAVAGYAMTGFSCTDANSTVTGNTGTFGSFNAATRVVTIPAVNIVAGADITCLITNTRSTVKFRKQSLGGTASFSFSTPVNLASAPAAIDTSTSNPGPVSPTAINVTTVGSQVQLTEAAVTGYTITGFSCIDANGSTNGNTGTFGSFNATTRVVTIPAANVVAGSDLTCTIANTKTPTVKFRKQSTGGTASFSFNTPVNLASAPAAIDTSTSNPGPASPTAINVTTIGSQVQLTEAAVAGYAMTGFSCTDANSAVTGNTGTFGTFNSATRVVTIPAANVVAGADITCLISNTRPTVKFKKQSVGGTASFSFNTPVNLASAPAAIDTSTSNPGPASPAAINVTTVGSQVQLTEAAVTGYAITGFACTDANSTVSGNPASFNGTFNASTRVVTIPAANIVAGADLTCTVTNTKTATVKFRKQSLGGTASFPFNTPVNIASAPAAIDTSISNPGPASPAAINVTTLGSQVQLTETAVAGYAITTFACSDANSAVSGNPASFNGTFNASTGVVTIPAANVVAGADLTCTVTNTKTPTVKFKKQSLGGTASFLFSTPVNLASAPAAIDTSVSNPGPVSPIAINISTVGSQVQLTETAVSSYTVTGFACTDANNAVSGNPASFAGAFNAGTGVVTIPAGNVVAGADLTCTITNTKLPTVTITKISNGGTGAFSFAGTNGFGTDAITTLSSGGSGTSGSPHVLTAASTATDITEAPPPGSFVLASISCNGLGSGGSATVSLATRTVNLDAAATAPGANILCTFINGVPGLTVTKAGTLNDGGDGVANAGDTISYSFTIANTGTVTLTNISASDPGATLSGGPIASLAPGVSDSTTITGTHTLTQAEVDSGSYANTVAITANPPTGPPVSANDAETVTLPSVPTFTVVKLQTAGPSPVTALPATITYTITVDNTGNRTLSAPTISDSLAQGTNGLTLTSGPTLTSGSDTDSDNALDTTETWIYTATYAVTQANLDHGGNIVNTATFDSAESAPVTSAPVSTSITQTPGLTIVKTADMAGPVGVNDVITYSYTVTNTGNVTINGVTVNDTHNGHGTPPVPGSETILTDQAPSGDSTDAAVNASWDVLAPGDSIKFTSTYTVTQTDVDLLQ